MATSYAKFRNIDNTIVVYGVLRNVKKNIQKHKLYEYIDNDKYHSNIKHAMSSVIH